MVYVHWIQAGAHMLLIKQSAETPATSYNYPPEKADTFFFFFFK